MPACELFIKMQLHLLLEEEYRKWDFKQCDSDNNEPKY